MVLTQWNIICTT